MSSSSTRVPTELWTEILGFFEAKSDHETLCHLNLTSRRFHGLARPLLFQDFPFYPYSVLRYGMSAEDLLLPPDPWLDLAHQRLQFWASEEIAPHVHDCTVQPLKFEEFGARISGQDPYTLLSAFFALLPRFANLENLYAFTIHFTRMALENLGRLPKLASVGIQMCTVADGETLDVPASSLKLVSFTFYNNEEQGEAWMRAISPDTLRVLRMNISELHYQGFFFGAESVLPTFPNCDTLDIVAGRAMPWIPITLTKFPALKNLNLSVSRFHTFPGFGGPAVIDPPELGGAGVCPLLKVYWGPCQILHLLPISQLLRLSIDACEPDDFRAEMQSISKSNDIRYLDITFSGYLSSFRGLFDIFSDLNVLQVTMLRRLFPEEDDQQLVYTLLDDLPSSLPQHLVRLAISWKVDEALDMPDIPDLPKQRDDIVAKCPTLETLWVHCANFAYVWSKLPDGTEGAVTGGPDIAAQVLPHFDWLFSNQ